MMQAQPLVATADPEILLDRHAHRRRAAVPTLSLLVGPRSTTHRVWRHWANREQLPILDAASFPFAMAWLNLAQQHVDIPTLVLQHLAGRLREDATTFRRRWAFLSPADRQVVWDIVPPQPQDSLLKQLQCGTVDAPAESLVSLCFALDPHAAWPCLWWDVDTIDQLDEHAHALGRWVERVPNLVVGLTTPSVIWDAYQQQARASRANALLREGAIPVAGPDDAEATATLVQAGLAPETATLLATMGANAELVAQAVQLTNDFRTTTPTTPDENMRARSKAEQHLFELLQVLPETAGRFRMNEKLDFRFGRKFAEVDFCCPTLRLVIEVDGFFHFVNSDAYRRDRTKDWELQKRGYVVLRFLAEDIVLRTEEIRERIVTTMQDRAGEQQ